METYHINEATFQIPDDWEDNSVNVFSIKDRGTEFSVVISRDNTNQHKQLDSYAKEQLKLLSEKLTDFKLISTDEGYVDGVPIVTAKFKWKSDAGIVNQYQGYMIHKQKAVVVTGTAPEKLFSKYERLIYDVLMSFKFRK